MPATYLSVFLTALLGLLQCRNELAEAPPPLPGWELVWADEFDTPGPPDSSRWSYDLGDGCPHLCGWGNNELQSYTDRPRNARVENGRLIIEAHRENYQGRAYTSARLLTRERAAWRFGRFEVRAKLPSGRGTWPAVWMLPETWEYGPWPKSGEIDIMEHVGFLPDSIFGTVHTEAFNHMRGTHKTGAVHHPDVEKDFHTYALEWSPEGIVWYFEDRPYHRFDNTYDHPDEWPFDQEFHLILNLAVGGNWGGARGVDSTIWPQRFEIDYVRVYRPADAPAGE